MYVVLAEGKAFKRVDPPSEIGNTLDIIIPLHRLVFFAEILEVVLTYKFTSCFSKQINIQFPTNRVLQEEIVVLSMHTRETSIKLRQVRQVPKS